MKLSTALLTAFNAALFVQPSAALPPKSCGGHKPLDFSLFGFAETNPVGGRTTGGEGGPKVTVSTPAELVAAVAGNDKKVIVIKEGSSFNLTSRLLPGSNKSIYGGGKGVTITGSGITIVNATNVIVRNLHIKEIVGNDGITISGSTRVWIDHNEFSSKFSQEIGPDYYDGLCDIIRGSDYITVSWNYFHDHWKTNLFGNDDTFRAIDSGHLQITYAKNYLRNLGTRGPAARFGRQHVFNNFYDDFHYQAIHSRSDNQVLVEGNVFRGDTREALSTYGLVIPEDSPNTSPDGDFEIDGFANLGAKNDWGPASINITQVGNFTKAPYKYKLMDLEDVERNVKRGAGIGKIFF